MNHPDIRYWFVGLAMLAAAGLSVAMTPTESDTSASPSLDLEVMIPEQFGDWRVDPSIVPIAPPPDLAAKLRQIYTQTLSRTYVNRRGDRIMLSIAYGSEQTEGLQTHVPEVCYPAQGFQVIKQQIAAMQSRFGEIGVKQLVATHGPRVEPISYWMTVGDKVTQAGLSWKLAQLRYGLTGRVADGMLVRVSNISRDERFSYALHQDFVNSLLDSVDPQYRVRLVGARDAS
jgi:EpsI family protein